MRLPKFDPTSNKLFQQRAARAFPLLVRQAKAEQPIAYSDLANELGMPNPRNLNHVLGAVASALLQLSRSWKEQLPALNLIVVNRATGIPGKGAAGVPDPSAFRHGTLAYRKRIIDRVLHDVFVFREWDRVLSHFGLDPLTLPQPPIPPAAPPDSLGQGGEGEDHRRLKEYVSRNPEKIGLKGFANGSTEHVFPSADAIDIFFKSPNRWVGVEVKGVRSTELDIRRGLYQCVKYSALIEAALKVEQKRIPVEVILVLGGTFPESLVAEKDTLGIQCRASITVPPNFSS